MKSIQMTIKLRALIELQWDLSRNFAFDFFGLHWMPFQKTRSPFRKQISVIRISKYRKNEKIHKSRCNPLNFFIENPMESKFLFRKTAGPEKFQDMRLQKSRWGIKFYSKIFAWFSFPAELNNSLIQLVRTWIISPFNHQSGYTIQLSDKFELNDGKK